MIKSIKKKKFPGMLLKINIVEYSVLFMELSL